EPRERFDRGLGNRVARDELDFDLMMPTAPASEEIVDGVLIGIDHRCAAQRLREYVLPIAVVRAGETGGDGLPAVAHLRARLARPVLDLHPRLRSLAIFGDRVGESWTCLADDARRVDAVREKPPRIFAGVDRRLRAEDQRDALFIRIELADEQRRCRFDDSPDRNRGAL